MSDTKPVLKAPYAHSVIVPRTTLALLADAKSDVNFSGYQDLKLLGSVVLQLEATAKLFMAEGMGDVARWMDLSAGIANITPTGPNAAVARTGSDGKPLLQQVQVGGIDFPIVPLTELALQASNINDMCYSGKKRGAIVIAEAGGNYSIMVASGALDTAPWYDTALAATTPIGGPKAKDGVKPVITNATLTAIPLWLVTPAQLADIADPVNAGDYIAEGKVAGAMAVVDAAVPYIVVAVGPLPGDKWIPVSGALTGEVVPA